MALGYEFALQVVHADESVGAYHIVEDGERRCFIDGVDAHGDVACIEAVGVAQGALEHAEAQALAERVAEAGALVEQAEGDVIFGFAREGDKHPVLHGTALAAALVAYEGTDAVVLEVVEAVEAGDDGHLVGKAVAVVCPLAVLTA